MTGIIVKSKIKEIVKELNVAGDVIEELENVVKTLLERATGRAKANQRKTLYARDL